MAVIAPNQLQSLVSKYFGDLGPQTVNLMTQIAMAESSGDTAAYNPNDPYGGSFGLFQINGVHGYDPRRLRTDPEYNLMAARQVFDKQGPQAWSTYGQVAGGGGGFSMPSFDFPWEGKVPFFGGEDDGGGEQPGDELDSLVNSLLGEGEAGAFDPYTSMTGNQRVELLVGNGWEWRSGNGQGAIWRNTRTGQVLPESEAIKAAIKAPSGSSGFSLSPGQTRYDASGRPIATAPSPNDPMAKMQQEEMDLRIKQQNLKFLQDKFAFESSQGLRKEANDTRQQIFRNQMDITRLQMDMQQQKQRLAMDIGTLAADPGDRGKLAGFITALGGQWGRSVTEDTRTDDSLMPLESLLRQGESLSGQRAPTAPTFEMPQPFDLAALMGTANPAANPATAPMAQAPVQPTMPYTPPTEEVPDTAQNRGINLADILGADQDLPARRHGGIEDEAFLAGEAGPEIVIPLGKGKTAVLNEEQAEAVGINLSKLMKMAGGGIFDGLVQDQDRTRSRGFLDESVKRALAGTPWEAVGSEAFADPVTAAGPTVDPLVMRLMAAINAQARGIPVSYYERQASLMRPQGVSEGPIRRSA